MTVELFRSDAYRSDFVARVTSCDGNWITLDRTCFWPGDGWVAPHDIGWLGAHEVVDVQREGSGLAHLIEADPNGRRPRPGDQLVGTIDWSLRYRLMRVHTAQHLVDLALRATHDVAGVTLSMSLDGVPTLSVVLASGDLDGRTVSEWVAGVVSDDVPMHGGRDLDCLGQRVWHLDGHGHRPCDGLHVCSTGEVGTVNLHKAGENGIRLGLQLEVGQVAEFTHGQS